MAKKRWLKAAALPASAVVLAAGLTAPAMASSHREAPLISQDPTADNTDLYMFRDSTDPTKVNIIADFIGLEDPNSGPNFTKFGDDVQYSIHLNNSGGVTDDIVYNFRFRTTVANTGTFLYNTGVVTSQADADLNVKQTYSIERVDAAGSQIVASNVPVPPVNVGQRSTPNYETVLAAPTVTTFNSGSSKVFAGSRQDPFFVDTGSVFDLLGLRPLNDSHAIPVGSGAKPGVNGLAGKNVHTIALQLPITAVNRNGVVPTTVDSKDSILGAYASTSRQRVKVLSLAGGAPRNAGRWVQVSRVGIPLVNEVLIPLARKDVFNSSAPKDDSQFFGDILDPEPAKLIPVLYPTVNTPPGGFNPDGSIKRTDIVAVLTGQGAGLSAANALAPADLLRVNLATPVSTGSAIKRLGVIDTPSDPQGFPNGRRLADDVTDVQLRLLAGGTFLNPSFNMSPNNALTDGVDTDDAPFLSVFPYAGTPYSGYSQNAATGSPNTAGAAAP